MTGSGRTPGEDAGARPVLEAGWLIALRARFSAVARRRVAADDV